MIGHSSSVTTFEISTRDLKVGGSVAERVRLEKSLFEKGRGGGILDLKRQSYDVAREV